MKIRTDSADDDALILLADGELVAILMQLADEAHGDDRGRWTVEATFGVGSPRSSAIFASAAHAAAWVSDHICHGWFFDLGRPIDVTGRVRIKGSPGKRFRVHEALGR